MRLRNCAVMLWIAPALATSAWAQKGASSAERSLYEGVNHERKAQDFRTLKWDDALAEAARRHAQEMAKRKSVEHRFPGEPSLPTRATKAGARFISISENVVQAASAKVAHSEFMHSANHKANILDPDVDSIGIGVSHRGGEQFIVEDFSKAKK